MLRALIRYRITLLWMMLVIVCGTMTWSFVTITITGTPAAIMALNGLVGFLYLLGALVSIWRVGRWEYNRRNNVNFYG